MKPRLRELKKPNGKSESSCLSAPGLGKLVLVMRDTTKCPEALKSSTVHLVGGHEPRLIVNEVSTLLDDRVAYEND